ncbi:MAG: Hsp20/alpha crystallin family protein [Planctomycetales bacterium]|nr:Hsp20/alpha crystallin family protein [Planctomycetales bacterium]
MASTITERSKAAAPAVRTSRDPFSAMREDMNDLISRMWHGYEGLPGMQQMVPALDVSETDNAFEVRMDSPGMATKDFDIQVHGNCVTLSGRRQEEKEEKGKTYHRMERRSGSFSRTLTLPCDINEDEVAAQYLNGVLSVTLPKSEKSKPKKISVKA